MAPEDSTLVCDLCEQLQPLRLAEHLVVPLVKRPHSKTTPDHFVITDSAVLRELAPDTPHLQRGTARLSGLYVRSFVLRHSATWLAFVLERLNGAPLDPSPPLAAHSPFVHFCGPLQRLVQCHELRLAGWHLSISARGLEWMWREPGGCSYFDPYQPCDRCELAPLQPGSTCATHWEQHPFRSPEPGDVTNPTLALRSVRQCAATRHSTMMNFYADFRNLRAFSDEELQRLSTLFSHRLLNSTTGTLAVSVAASTLGYNTLEDVLSRGPDELKRRYRGLVKQHHPDRGGHHDDFHHLTACFATLQQEFPQRNTL